MGDFMNSISMIDLIGRGIVLINEKTGRLGITVEEIESIFKDSLDLLKDSEEDIYYPRANRLNIADYFDYVYVSTLDSYVYRLKPDITVEKLKETFPLDRNYELNSLALTKEEEDKIKEFRDIDYSYLVSLNERLSLIETEKEALIEKKNRIEDLYSKRYGKGRI